MKGRGEKHPFQRKTQKKVEVIPVQKSEAKTRITRRIKSLNCSPAVNGKTTIRGSCFTPNVLINIKTNFNRIYPDKKITSTDPREIWQSLHDHLINCSDEVCWLNVIKDPVERNKIQQAIFAPNQPADWQDNPNEWLSNYDIFHVIRQYEETYPEFEFIGPTTIDFDAKPKTMDGNCVEEELCKISLKSLLDKKKTKIGVIFNLDKHTEDGSHWVSLFIDMTEGVIFFFDSSAGGLPNEIRKLVNRLIKESDSLNISNTNSYVQRSDTRNELNTAFSGRSNSNLHSYKTSRPIKKHSKSLPISYVLNNSTNTVKYMNKLKFPLKLYNNGKFRHQYSSTECGMYSLFFIITMLTGKTKFTGENIMPMKERIRLFLKKKIPDKVVSDYRDLYFNPLPKKVAPQKGIPHRRNENGR